MDSKTRGLWPRAEPYTANPHRLGVRPVDLFISPTSENSNSPKFKGSYIIVPSTHFKTRILPFSSSKSFFEQYSAAF